MEQNSEQLLVRRNSRWNISLLQTWLLLDILDSLAGVSQSTELQIKMDSSRNLTPRGNSNWSKRMRSCAILMHKKSRKQWLDLCWFKGPKRASLCLRLLGMVDWSHKDYYGGEASAKSHIPFCATRDCMMGKQIWNRLVKPSFWGCFYSPTECAEWIDDCLGKSWSEDIQEREWTYLFHETISMIGIMRNRSLFVFGSCRSGYFG